MLLDCANITQHVTQAAVALLSVYTSLNPEGKYEEDIVVNIGKCNSAESERTETPKEGIGQSGL